MGNIRNIFKLAVHILYELFGSSYGRGTCKVTGAFDVNDGSVRWREVARTGGPGVVECYGQWDGMRPLAAAVPLTGKKNGRKPKAILSNIKHPKFITDDVNLGIARDCFKLPFPWSGLGLTMIGMGFKQPLEG